MHQRARYKTLEPQSPNDDPQVRRFDSRSSGESDSVPQRGGSFSREITVC